MSFLLFSIVFFSASLHVIFANNAQTATVENTENI